MNALQQQLDDASLLGRKSSPLAIQPLQRSVDRHLQHLDALRLGGSTSSHGDFGSAEKHAELIDDRRLDTDRDTCRIGVSATSRFRPAWQT